MTFYLDGFFRHDDLLEGMTQYYLNYRVSIDGGRTSVIDERFIQRGGYTPEHPCEHVWIGRNCMSIPTHPAVVRTRQGHLVAAIMISVLGPDGQYSNPGGGLTWLEELILIGRWQDAPGIARSTGKIEWDCGPRLSLPPELSTRGLDESTLAEMPDGRLLLVLRASNGGTRDPEFRIPGHKWYAVSADGGFTWTTPQRWGYAEGGLVHSPASMGQILRHSSGRYFWFGNICAENPRANHPRYPLVAAEIDPVSFQLIRESVAPIATRGPNDPVDLQLSNFSAHEDRADGTIILEMPWFVQAAGKWTGDTYRYRLAI